MSLSHFPLNLVGLTPHQLAACNRAGLTSASEILTLSTSELQRRLKFHRIEGVHELVLAISRAVTPKSFKIDDLLDDAALQNSSVASLVYENRNDGIRQDDARNGTAGNAVDRNGSAGRGTRMAAGGSEMMNNEVDELCMRWGQPDWVSTGDPEIDTALGGGIRTGVITEIAGESAAGKSQFTLLLALAAQLPSLTTNPGAVMALTSEGEVSTDRLIQLAKTMLSKHGHGRDVTIKTMLDSIHTNTVTDVEQLDHMLEFSVPLFLSSRRASTHSALKGERRGPIDSTKRPIRLLVIDSITALIRGATKDKTYHDATTVAGLTSRSKHLCSVTDKLKAMAVEYQLAVVVINQVSDVFSRPTPFPASSAQASQKSQRSSQYSQYFSDYPQPPMIYSTQARWFSGRSESLGKEASMGIVWANAINTRIMLSRTGRRRLLNQEDLTPISRKKLKEQMDERREAALSQAQPNGSSQNQEVETSWIDIENVKPTLIRRLHVVFSPIAPAGTLDYVTTPDGIHSIRDSYRMMDEEARKRRKKGKGRKAPVNESSSQDGDGDVEEDTVGGLGEEQELQDVPPSDDYGDEIFDDLGEMPPEFWEGR